MKIVRLPTVSEQTLHNYFINWMTGLRPIDCSCITSCLRICGCLSFLICNVLAPPDFKRGTSMPAYRHGRCANGTCRSCWGWVGGRRHGLRAPTGNKLAISPATWAAHMSTIGISRAWLIAKSQLFPTECQNLSLPNHSSLVASAIIAVFTNTATSFKPTNPINLSPMACFYGFAMLHLLYLTYSTYALSLPVEHGHRPFVSIKVCLLLPSPFSCSSIHCT